MGAASQTQAQPQNFSRHAHGMRPQGGRLLGTPVLYKPRAFRRSPNLAVPALTGESVPLLGGVSALLSRPSSFPRTYKGSTLMTILMQDPTPGQLLSGQAQPPSQPVGTPLATRLAQDPSAQPLAQPQAAPQPTSEQAMAAKHHALGKVTSFLFGNERDPNTGEPVKQAPGAVFRSLLAGALLGGAIGSEGH